MKFYTSISDYYHHIFPLNKAQAEFISKTFHKTEKLDLLDIGCGIGELSFELAKYFKSVYAIDLDEGMINRAKLDFGKNTTNLEFSILNMLDIENTFDAKAFDSIVCFGNTLVHLKGPTQILDFFKQARKILKKNGKLLLQIINYDRIIEHNIKALPTIENEDIRFVRNYRLHPDQKKLDFETILTVKKSGKTIKNTIQLYPLRKSELDKLLIEGGFKEIRYFGNFNRVAIKCDNIPLVIEAE